MQGVHLVNLREIRKLEEDLCKECTRPTLRQSVERCLKAQESTRRVLEVKYFNFTKIRRDSAFAHKISAERNKRPRPFEV
jgi:hypothetical protein